MNNATTLAHCKCACMRRQCAEHKASVSRDNNMFDTCLRMKVRSEANASDVGNARKLMMG